MKELRVGCGEMALHYRIEFIGEDLEVVISGGDSHIGSVSLVFDGEITTVTAESHRDNFLTEPLARSLSQIHRGRIVVMGGFHLDNISEEQIAEVLKQHQTGMQEVIEHLKSRLD